uniref:Topoisomerase 6 subunit A/Spo11 TOPRIM domain-containing protein n=2 Tax=Aegilops tauschii subsp. strangulata TaxID=200361 RepID=A0A453LT53_AEGTS
MFDGFLLFTQGRGYPDIPTRRFLRYLVEQLHLPAYCLVDSDPYGFDILATYKFGSMVGPKIYLISNYLFEVLIASKAV